MISLILNPVKANSGLSLSQSVLPSDFFYIKILIKFSDLRAVIVGQNKLSFVLSQ